jgi:hypothetical protein
MSTTPMFTGIYDPKTEAGNDFGEECIGEDTRTPPSTGGPDGGEWIRLSEVAPERVSWLQPSRLALGKLTLWDGDPGLGKGFALMSLAAAVSTGSELPGRGEFGPADVILLSSEDGLADTIRPRLDAAGGDPSRIHVLSFVRRKGEKFFPSLKRDMDVIERKVAETRARLLGIDPFMGFLGVKDSHRDADVKEALGPFAQMLDRLKLAAVGIRHLNKSQVASSLYRGGGSIGIIGAARSAFLFAADPDDGNRRIVAATKANLCPMPPSLAFTIRGTPNGSARAIWEPRTNEHRADALLRSAIETQGAKRAGVEAAEWLAGALKDGPVLSKDLAEEGAAKGVAFKTVREAGKKLGVLIEREKGKKGRGAWMWRMPGTGDLVSLPRRTETRKEGKEGASFPSSPSSLLPLVSLSPQSEEEEEGPDR